MKPSLDAPTSSNAQGHSYKYAIIPSTHTIYNHTFDTLQYDAIHRMHGNNDYTRKHRRN
jgi:hypothetical protein